MKVGNFEGMDSDISEELKVPSRQQSTPTVAKQFNENCIST
jgi:hypothetical protein